MSIKARINSNGREPRWDSQDVWIKQRYHTLGMKHIERIHEALTDNLCYVIHIRRPWIQRRNELAVRNWVIFRYFTQETKKEEQKANKENEAEYVNLEKVEERRGKQENEREDGKADLK